MEDNVTTQKVLYLTKKPAKPSKVSDWSSVSTKGFLMSVTCHWCGQKNQKHQKGKFIQPVEGASIMVSVRD